MVSNTRIIAPKKKKKKNADILLVQVSESSAIVKGSVEKVNRDLSVVRRLSLPDAMNYLYFSPYGSADDVAKIIKSAAANAMNKGLVNDLKDLIVDEVYATKAFQLKRMRAGSRGRPSPRSKAYSKVFVKLSIESK